MSIHSATAEGAGFVDPVTGDLLLFTPRPIPSGIYGRTLYQLHTTAGLWRLAIILGIGALGVPGPLHDRYCHLGGVADVPQRSPVGYSRRDADTVILVGSEGNTTWGFAGALTTALIDSGSRAASCSHEQPGPVLARARRMLAATATYGEGDAPASASGSLDRLELMSDDLNLPYAVLGFGDKQFPEISPPPRRACPGAQGMAAIDCCRVGSTGRTVRRQIGGAADWPSRWASRTVCELHGPGATCHR